MSLVALVAKREVRLDAGDVGGIHDGRLGHFAFEIGTFCGEKVSAAGLRANDLACSGDLEALGYGLAGFTACDWFWHWKSS